MRHESGELSGYDGLALHCQSWHPATKSQASLIIVHGLGEHGGRYMNIVRELIPLQFSIYACDHRGHGRSSGQRGYVQRFAEFRDDVSQVVQHVQQEQGQDKPLFLMGHSLGGLIVLDSILNGQRGIQGAVLSAPALDSGAISPFLIMVSRLLSRVWPTLSVKTGLDVSGISRDPQVLIDRANDPLIHGVGTPRLATESTLAMLNCFENVDQLEIPLLMYHGTSDRITSPIVSRSFFDQIDGEDKTYIAYDGGFHESHKDLHHEQVTADIADWLLKRL